MLSKVNLSNGVYSKNAVSMGARKTNGAIVRDFKKFLKENNLILNAKLTPIKEDTFYTELELAKAELYTTTPLTDSNGYALSSNGFSLNDAILEMAKKYKGQPIYLNTGTLKKGKMPNFFA